MAGLQQLEHFIEQAALRHLVQQRLAQAQRLGRFGLQRKAQVRQLGRKAHGADDAYGVFAVALLGVANHAQHALLCVFNAFVVIDHDLRARVVVHGVDGEVTPRRVLVLRPPDVVAQHAPAGVHGVRHARQGGFAGALVAADLLGIGAIQVGAEGGDFNHLMLAPAPMHHVNDAKAPPNDEGAAKEVFHLFGRGVGGHVKVFGAQAQQQIAHRTAHDVGGVARVLQRADNVKRAPIHQRGVNAVHAGGHFHTFAKTRFARAHAVGFAQQFVDEFFDHGWAENRSRMRQPRCAARARRRSSGLVATGVSTFSSKGMSLVESL